MLDQESPTVLGRMHA